MQQRFFHVLQCVGLVALTLLAVACTTASPQRNYKIDRSNTAVSSDSRVHLLVIHYTAEDAGDSLAMLTGEKVSAHYLIDDEPETRSGQPVVRQLVPENKRAWHAGASYWRGRSNLNDTSIGIELVNAGYRRDGVTLSWQPYTEQQIEPLIALSRDIIKRHQITAINVVGHSDIAPQRKNDPGPLFPWKRLAEAGIGAWPDADNVRHYLQIRQAETQLDVSALQQNLRRYGYKVPDSGELDEATLRVVRAFQMHFRQTDYSGHPDAETLAILDALLEKYQL